LYVFKGKLLRVTTAFFNHDIEHVKFITARFLLLLYGFAAFGQIIPIISDAVSHSFALAIHIATVHARYGTNHLDKEMAGVISHDTKNQHSAKHIESFEVHFLSERHHDALQVKKDTGNFAPLLTPFIKQVVIFKLSPPPRFC
jgi:hypothetical protein